MTAAMIPRSLLRLLTSWRPRTIPPAFESTVPLNSAVAVATEQLHAAPDVKGLQHLWPSKPEQIRRLLLAATAASRVGSLRVCTGLPPSAT